MAIKKLETVPIRMVTAQPSRNEMWLAVVEGLAYGFHDSEQSAKDWASKEFPVAHAQGRVTVVEFCSFS